MNVNKMDDDNVLKAEQSAQELVDSVSFQNDVQALRKKWGVPEGGTSPGFNPLAWQEQCNLDEKLKGQQLNQDIRTTLIANTKYGLTERSVWALRHYIFDNEHFVFEATMPEFITWWDEGQEEQATAIQFFDRTTERELVEVFRHYKRSRDSVKPHFALARVKHNKLRYSYELREKGLKPTKIAELLNDKFGTNDTYVEVNRYIREYKKRLIK